MEEVRKLSEITAVLMDHVKKLRVLADEASQFESRLVTAIGNLNPGILSHPAGQGSKMPAIIEFRSSEKPGVPDASEKSRRTVQPVQPLFPSGLERANNGFSNIISFPGPFRHTSRHTTGAASRGANNFAEKQPLFRGPIMAIPGKPINPEVPDFRPVLQRDGLILLAWDKRINERGSAIRLIGLPVREYPVTTRPDRTSRKIFLRPGLIINPMPRKME